MPTISFIPQSLDLACYAGDGASVQIVVSRSGTPIDVTGDHVAQIRIARLDPDPIDAFIIDDSSANEGVLILILTGEQTAAFGDGFKGVWDLQWTADQAEPVTLVQGKITCVIDVTRTISDNGS